MIGTNYRGIVRVPKTNYVLQRGSGPGGRLIIYSKGRGLGSFLKTAFSYLSPIISPFLRQSMQAVGSEILRSGSEIVDKYGGEKSIKELISEQQEKTKANLKKRAVNKAFSVLTSMKGSGYKRRRADPKLAFVSQSPSFKSLASKVKAAAKKLKRRKPIKKKIKKRRGTKRIKSTDRKLIRHRRRQRRKTVKKNSLSEMLFP